MSASTARWRSCVVACMVALLMTVVVGLRGAPADLPEMDGVPTAEPETVGMSSERLERLDRVMQGYVDRNEVAGVVTLVARRGKVVHFSATGQRDVEQSRAMTHDTVFRMASMTKPIASVALMMLYEGRALPASRSHLAVAPGVRRHAGRRPRAGAGAHRRKLQAGAGRASDHGPARADPYGRAGEHLPGPDPGGVSGDGGRTKGDGHGGRHGEAAGPPAAQLPPRRPLGVRAGYRRRGPARRGDVRPVARRLPARANLRAARDAGHPLLPDRGETRPLRRALRSGRRREDRADGGADGGEPIRPGAACLLQRSGGPGVDCARLLPLPPDDAQRRRARRCAVAEPQDDRADDGQPHRRLRDLARRSRLRVRARVRPS